MIVFISGFGGEKKLKLSEQCANERLEVIVHTTIDNNKQP
jgi:hypothetical protein